MQLLRWLPKPSTLRKSNILTREISLFFFGGGNFQEPDMYEHLDRIKSILLIVTFSEVVEAALHFTKEF